MSNEGHNSRLGFGLRGQQDGLKGKQGEGLGAKALANGKRRPRSAVYFW